MFGDGDVVHAVSAILRHIEGGAGRAVDVHILACGLGCVVLHKRNTSMLQSSFSVYVSLTPLT